MRRALLAVLLACLLFIIPAAASQGVPYPSATFLVRGTVLDASRSPIAGAQVTAIAGTQPPAGSAMTDERGMFALTLPSGQYTLKVVADGFEEATGHVATSRSGTVMAEFVLQVASVHETVTVAALAGYQGPDTRTATRTLTPLRDVPQSVTVVTQALIKDQMMMSAGDVMRYVPGVMVHQG